VNYPLGLFRFSSNSEKSFVEYIFSSFFCGKRMHVIPKTKSFSPQYYTTSPKKLFHAFDKSYPHAVPYVPWNKNNHSPDSSTHFHPLIVGCSTEKNRQKNIYTNHYVSWSYNEATKFSSNLHLLSNPNP